MNYRALALLLLLVYLYYVAYDWLLWHGYL